MLKYIYIVFHAILDLLLAMLVFIPMRLIKVFKHEPFDQWAYSEKSNSTTAIVLVHGSGVNEAQFIPARRILARLAGNDLRVYSCDLNAKGSYQSNPTESIETYAARLEYYIRQNVLTQKTDKLVLVGHSMGGLVAGFLVDRLPVNLLVTIGTPWQGARALKWVYGYPGFNTERHKQMCPNSDFLRKLKEKVKNSKVPLMTIGCEFDFQVLEHDAHLWIDNEILYSTYTGHISVIILENLWRTVLKQI